MIQGHLYGIGVGPGDPELLTLKAARLIRDCDICFCPGQTPENTVAYKIAMMAVPELKEKEVAGLEMPMTKNAVQLEKSHKQAVKTLKEALDAGKKAIFLTLGDISVYSTFSYVAGPLMAEGYGVSMVPGIPSFIAAAARAKRPLACKDEEIHIVPATYKKEVLEAYKGTTVYMKAGKKLRQIKACSEGKPLLFAENIGMPDERIEANRLEMPDEAGYYTLVIRK